MTHHVQLCARLMVLCSIVACSAVSTVAGSSGNPGLVDSTNPLQARFNAPKGVSLDASGNVIVGDVGNNCIRVITPAGGTIDSIAVLLRV